MIEWYLIRTPKRAQTHAHKQVYIEDLRDEFVKDYVFWAVKVRCGDLDEAMGDAFLVHLLKPMMMCDVCALT